MGCSLQHMRHVSLQAVHWLAEFAERVRPQRPQVMNLNGHRYIHPSILVHFTFTLRPDDLTL